MHRKLRIDYNAPVTLTFALVCALALALNKITGGWANGALFSVYRCRLSDPLAWFRFIGHVLGHAGYSHFIGNMTLILVLGPNLEERLGSRDVALAILMTAAVSGAAQFMLFPGTALLGASGIVFMMILLSSFGNSKSGSVPLTLVLVAVFYIGGEILTAVSASDNISQLAHIAGGICGTASGFLLRKKNQKA